MKKILIALLALTCINGQGMVETTDQVQKVSVSIGPSGMITYTLGNISASKTPHGEYWACKSYFFNENFNSDFLPDAQRIYQELQGQYNIQITKSK